MVPHFSSMPPKKGSAAPKPAASKPIDLTIDAATAAKVAQLRAIEAELQADWDAHRLYEIDAPADGSTPKKFFVTFPYPYMNGRVHLGHVFTSSKAEFAVRYHRMKGEYALFPFGFHCTGMPVRASADRLAAELDSGTAVTADAGTVKGAKAAAKTESGASQASILRHMEVPEAEIP
jgi:leucyl-tRNA synthetase